MISIANPTYGEGPALYKLAEHGTMQSKLARNTWLGPENCQTRPWPEVCVSPLSMPSSSGLIFRMLIYGDMLQVWSKLLRLKPK